ncbi:BlaI/MecI/CopY family transcriptional regulator [Telmatocola sphagniphila]|uniref:BlaI/MecI/CopY family transcriptional regulator n=1 Tax=Telmatocola sphagniphila TaxID=1123043 RepID=UPI001FE43007|nr:BlaI/MecI/CopY family transcriptional regulator [Telmatocola sphagniphila]
MARTARDVTDAELAILELLWANGPCSVRQLAEIQQQAGAPTQAATVQKLLERLESKEWVERRRDEPVMRFSALGNRDDLIGQRLQSIAEQLCEGSLTPLLTHLVKQERLTNKDRQQLKQLIEDLDSKKKGV